MRPPIHGLRPRATATACFAALVAAASLWGPGCARPRPYEPVRAAELEGRLRDAVLERIAAGATAREDGWTYAVDVGQLLVYAGRAGDRELYPPLGELARELLIQDEADDPYTRGMVAWRGRPDAAPEASGTTEALRVARGLWLGARAFGRPADRELARAVLAAYARHAAEDQGVWLVRNYFNFGTRAFATNSFLVDYAPDFVAEAARDLGSAELEGLAERSYALVSSAGTPAGLLYDLVQPEVLTLTPARGPAGAIFSPNDVVQLSNAATVAEQCAGGLPGPGRRVLRFAAERPGALRLFYLGRSGEPVDGSPPAGAETYAVLARLAAALGERAAVERYGPRVLAAAEDLAGDPHELSLIHI